MEWFILYLTSVALSYAGKIEILLSMMLELKSAGYNMSCNELENYINDIIPNKKLMFRKTAPFIPVYNIAESLWFINETIKNKDLIYLSLNMLDAVEEVKPKKETANDGIKEESKLNNVYKKVESLYDEHKKLNKKISYDDLDMIINTLHFVKRETKDEELKDKVSNFEQLILSENVDTITPNVIANKKSLCYQKTKCKK